MKIVIQGYWGAEVTACKRVLSVTPEEYLKTHTEIHICDIIIDGKIVGTVAWNGKELSISDILKTKEKSPLQALKEANKRNKGFI